MPKKKVVSLGEKDSHSWQKGLSLLMKMFVSLDEKGVMMKKVSLHLPWSDVN